jgi:hypothetical protein
MKYGVLESNIFNKPILYVLSEALLYASHLNLVLLVAKIFVYTKLSVMKLKGFYPLTR